MSARLFGDDVLFLQRLLSCCGVYSGSLTGTYDAQTSMAEATFDQPCQVAAATRSLVIARAEFEAGGR